MSDTTDNIIAETALRILRDHCEVATVNDAEKGVWPTALWDALEESGLTLTWVSDEFGGAGAGILDGFAVLRVAGNFAAPVPLAETLLAGHLLAAAGIDVPSGPMTLAPVHADGNIALVDGRLQGRARGVPFARNARHVAVLAKRRDMPVVALVDPAGLTIRQGANLAGEPRDEVSFDGVLPRNVREAPAGLDLDALRCWGAAARLQQMAGALERILDQSVQYSMERSQFGRPIGKFQVIQQNLAEMAGEVAAAGAAADAAAHALATQGNGDKAVAEIAIGKVRAGEAASAGAAIAHQVHGAMGFTYEHSLHQSTRRLWSWREEFGNEASWAIRLGRIVSAQGADALWPFVTAGS